MGSMSKERPQSRLTGMLAIVLAAVFLLPAMSSCAGDAELFKTQAAKLTEDKKTRMDKINAIFAFVRDEVKQVPTKYG